MTSEHLIIFDCDGVLVDSEPIYVRVDTEIFNEIGWEISEAEVIERFQGTTDMYLLSTLEDQVGREARITWEPILKERRRDTLEAELQPIDGIVEALDAIDLPTCVASSSSHEFIELVLRVTGLFDRFAGRIFSGHDVKHGKPAPDVFLLAAEAMGYDPAACIVVEDSVHGAEAGRAAGMKVLGYDPDGDKALDGENTIVFDDMRDLPRLIDAQ